MSIIGGRAKGKRLKALRGVEVRPTAGRIKEALFNILAERIQGAAVLDLFAGSGSLGIEALSRGAKETLFVDSSSRCVNVIRGNLELCGFTGKAEILKATVQRAIARLHREGKRFDIVLLDPPYERGLAAESLVWLGRWNLSTEKGWVVAEHSVREALLGRYGPLKILIQRRYGDTILSIFEKETEEE